MNWQYDDDQIQMNDWMKSMHTLVKSIDHNYIIQSGSISIIPEVLKQSNGDAYMPRVVSIGPRFKGSREYLLFMEEVKLQCMLYLFHRAGNEGEVGTYLEECSKAIWKLDEHVHASYVADIKLEKHELAKIMLVDGCFLLELLVTKGLDAQLEAHFGSRLVPLSPAREVLTNEDVLSDLMLLENQIPILVLHELSRLLFPHVFEQDLKQRATRINNLVLSVLGYSDSPPQVQSLGVGATHILDVVHVFVNNRKAEREREISEDFNQVVVVDIMERPNYAKLEMKRCALRLLAAGITIKLSEDTDSGALSALSCFTLLRNCFSGILTRLGHIFIPAKQHTNLDMPAGDLRGLDFEFKFKFKKGELGIAQLHITKTTKARWCNVIAWEHNKKNRERSSISATSGDEMLESLMSPTSLSLSGKFTFAALIFNGLICSVDDVQLLKDNNIIVDHLKMSNDELLAFLRTISLGVNHGVVDSSFIKTVDELNNYSPPNCLIQTWKKVRISFTYRQEWFLRFIRFMNRNYNFVATVVAALTVVQTAYAIQAYHHPKSPK